MASRATYTTNLNLVKPDVDDSYDITLSNDNMDKVDKAVGDLKQEIKETISSIDMSANKVAYTDTHTIGATNVQQVVDKVIEKTTRTQVELTIERAKWSGNKYSLEAKYPFSQYDVYILDYGATATEAEMFAWGDAMVKGSMTENVLTAIGTKPTIDVHVVIELVKKGA